MANQAYDDMIAEAETSSPAEIESARLLVIHEIVTDLTKAGMPVAISRTAAEIAYRAINRMFRASMVRQLDS